MEGGVLGTELVDGATESLGQGTSQVVGPVEPDLLQAVSLWIRLLIMPTHG